MYLRANTNASWRTTLIPPTQRRSSTSASSTIRTGPPSKTRNLPSNISPRVSKQVRCQLPLRRSPIHFATVDPSDAQRWYLSSGVLTWQAKSTTRCTKLINNPSRNDRNPTFWNSIGVLYFQINQFHDALDAYLRAIRINPYISEVWFDIGRLYKSWNTRSRTPSTPMLALPGSTPATPLLSPSLEECPSYRVHSCC